jgi:hypothetical protein
MNNARYIEARTEGADSSCYRFEKIEFINGLLDLDATYVIHLENNGRLDHIKSQLNEFHPTKLVYILYNKGYKKCNKDAYIDKPPLDLVDAFLYIFKDAQEKNYKNILILEDDFIFNKKIKDKKVQQHIMNFINNKNYDIYALGILPGIQRAYDNNTSICVIGGTTHALIYSRNYINKVLQEDKRKIIDWDLYTRNTFRRYIYNEPLCYQTFPETENQKYWDDGIIVKISLYIIKLLKLDVQVEPGYSIIYFASRVLYGLCVILLVWLVIIVFNITI